MTLGEELKRLADLHSQGSLTDVEYEAAKRKVIGSGSSEPEDPPFVPPPSQTSRPRQPTNGLAIASLILGLFGMGIGHILALIFGYRAKQQIDAADTDQGGRSLAIAGIVLGWIGVSLLAILLIIFLASQLQRQGPSEQQVADAETVIIEFLNDVADAERAYKTDNGEYAEANELVDGGYVDTPPGVRWETRFVEENQFCVKASHTDLDRSWKVSSYSWGQSDEPFVPRALGGC